MAVGGLELISVPAGYSAVPLFPLSVANYIKLKQLVDIIRPKTYFKKMTNNVLPRCYTRIKPVLVPGRFVLGLSISQALICVLWFWLMSVNAGGKAPASVLLWVLPLLTLIAAHLAEGHERLYYPHVALHGNLRLHLSAPTAHPSAPNPEAQMQFVTWWTHVLHEVWKEPKLIHLSATGAWITLRFTWVIKVSSKQRMFEAIVACEQWWQPEKVSCAHKITLNSWVGS